MSYDFLTFLGIAVWITVIILILVLLRLIWDTKKQKNLYDLEMRNRLAHEQAERLRQARESQERRAQENAERESALRVANNAMLVPQEQEEAAGQAELTTLLPESIAMIPVSRSGNGAIPSDISNQSGGVDLYSDTTTIVGDVVGRDKITYINTSNIREVKQQRRVEATFPAQPVVGQIESLYVQVKMPESPVSLEARARTLAMPFRADAGTGAALATPFKIKVIAPEFRIYGGDEEILQVSPDEDSVELEFQLQCETERAVRIQVKIYAESAYLDQIVLPVSPVVAAQVPQATERMWNRGVSVLGTLSNATVSTSW
jgi:hypothetical protein